VVQRAPRPAAGLDLAEGKLTNGDADGAAVLAEQALKDNSGDAARANFILARAAILNRDVDMAQKDFAETIRLAKDPRLLAWSHIYLGRLYDIEDERDHAVSEYQAALVARDDRPDTKLAAEEGLKQPYAVPQRSHAAGGADQSDPSDNAPPAPASGGGQVGAPGVGSPR
jgi:tetratricopeptide (TPR) repeat protein